MDFDTCVRLQIYQEVIASGDWPRVAQLAATLQASESEVRAGCGRLYAAHTGIVPQKKNGELLFAAPFSAVPTPFHVEVKGRRWFAPCGWDALGIVALLGGTGTIHTSCPCCGEVTDIGIANGVLQDSDGWMNLVVPAKQFWDDIVFT